MKKPIKITSIRLVISQPAVRRAPSEWDCSHEELELAFPEIAKDAHQVKLLWKAGTPEQIEAACTPGEKQCAYCTAAATCPPLARLVSETVFMSDGKLDAADVPVPYEPSDVNLLSARYLRIPLIETWIEAVSAKVYRLLKTGAITEKQGLKFVEGRKGHREWTDAEKAEELLKSFKLKREEMYTEKLISPTQAEKVLADNPRRWGKIKDLITQPEGKPTIAHVSDRRAALVTSSPTAGFENLDEPESQAGAENTPPPELDDGSDLC